MEQAPAAIRKAVEENVAVEFGRGEPLLARTEVVKKVAGDAIEANGYLTWKASRWVAQQPGCTPGAQALLNIAAMALCEIVDDTRP